MAQVGLGKSGKIYVAVLIKPIEGPSFYAIPQKKMI